MTSLNFKCNRCDGKFQTVISLMKHRNVPSKCNGRKCGDVLQKICLSASMVYFLKHNRNFKPIQCKTCQKGFSQISSFFVHLRIHSKQAPYVCDYCSKTFIIGLNLGRHLESHKKDVQHLPKCERCSNDIDKLTKMLNVSDYSDCCRCPFCYKNIKADTNFIVAHIRIHFPEHSTCAKCNFRIIRFRKIMVKLKSKVLLQSPDRSFKRPSQTGNSMIECERCGVWFKQNQLALHLISHSMEQLLCRYCDVIFRSRYLLKKHEITCENKDVIIESERMTLKSASLKERNSKQCPFCSQTFVSFTTLKKHLPTHAENYTLKSDMESLEEKPGETTRETDLETNSKHFRAFSCINVELDANKSGERNLKPNTVNQCSYCFAIFQSVSERNLHEKNHYKIPSFSSEFHSKEYQIQQHSKLLYQCKYCQKVFISAHSLNFHMDCHFGKPPFLCKICWKVFTNSNDYFDHEKEHLIVQNKDDPHNVLSCSLHLCEVCGEVFQNLNIFKEHLKSHEIKCSFCSTYFSTEKSLQDHMKQHLVPIIADNDASKPSAPLRENIGVQYSTPEARRNELTLANFRNNIFQKAETIYTYLVPDKRNNLSMPPQSCATGLDSAPFYENRASLVPFSPYRFEPHNVSSFCERPLLQTGSKIGYYNPPSSQKNKNDITFSMASGNGFSRVIDGNETYSTKPTYMNINYNFSNREKIGLPCKSVSRQISENLGIDNFDAFKDNISTVSALETITTKPTNLRYRDHYTCSNTVSDSKNLYLKAHFCKNSFESSNILDNRRECNSISDISLDKYSSTLDIRDDENQLINQKENDSNPVFIQMKLDTRASFLDRCDDSNWVSQFNENNRSVIDTNSTIVSRSEQSVPETWESKQKGIDSNKCQLNERTNLVTTSPLKKPESKGRQPVDFCFNRSNIIDEEIGCQPRSKIKNIYGEYNIPKYSDSLKRKSVYVSSQSDNNDQDKEGTYKSGKKFLKTSEVHLNWNNGNKSEELMITKMPSKTPENTGNASCNMLLNECCFNDPNNNTLYNNLINYGRTTLATSCDRVKKNCFIQQHPNLN